MNDVLSTSADQVCTANPGCMLQLDAGIARFDLNRAMMPRIRRTRSNYWTSRTGSATMADA